MTSLTTDFFLYDFNGIIILNIDLNIYKIHFKLTISVHTSCTHNVYFIWMHCSKYKINLIYCITIFGIWIEIREKKVTLKVIQLFPKYYLK
jgi:hypothetical protein